jgi:glyoxylase-like metal-dependent hydrolase (beta-lactamase superfamily II)
MQEIAAHVFIETNFPGVTLGAINTPHGLILIDSPLRADDTRSWRSALLNLGGGVDRLLVNLDAHFDRTLGVRAMDCTVVAHEKVSQIFRNRPVTFKTQGSETGAEWELYNNLGSIRWAPPEITFTDEMTIHWGSNPIRLEYRPGPSIGSIWVNLPEDKILFMGDTITPDQPPYLASADVPTWIEALRLLFSDQFKNHTLVSGRSGLVTHEQAHVQLVYLEQVRQRIEELVEGGGRAEDTETLISPLLQAFVPAADRRSLYEQRLRWGLRQYFLRRNYPESVEIEE